MEQPKWTQDEAIAFECARERITDLMGIYHTAIADEEEKPTPNREKIARYESITMKLARERANLSVTDHEKIADIRREYGACIRSYRDSASTRSIWEKIQ